MSKRIIAQSQVAKQARPDFTLEEWKAYAQEFLDMRRGLWEATPDEALVGYVDGFTPVYVTPWEKTEGESWYVWFIFPGEGRAARIVNEIVPGSYMDHKGNVLEHDPELMLVLGTISRKGTQPLLSREMFR